ncbi:MAG: hypothetical protein WHT28_01425 [Fimbriimonadales bacterium]|jgi:GT2 family glycosyltransferase
METLRMRLAELALVNLPCGRWEPIRVLDLGCERGDSTRILQHHLPYATVHGTDETHWLGYARQVIGQAFLPPGLVRPDYELVVVLGTGETVRERLEEALRLTTRWVVAVAPLGVVRESEWQKWGFQAHREFGILPEDGVWWVGVYDRQQAVVPCERVLIAAPVRQQPEILQVFLEAQRQLDTAGLEVAYLFVDNNDDPRSTQILKGFAESVEHLVTLWHAAPGSGYQRTEHTHYWEVGIVWRLAALKDRMLRYALEEGYDALWILDSDLVVAPNHLKHLIAQEAPIVVSVFWTNWLPGDPPLPNVWLGHPYQFYRPVRGQALPEAEAQRRSLHFIESLVRAPGLYRVYGGGACTLIRREALERGVSFAEVKGVPYKGEDAHFCLRAESLGIPIFAESRLPPLHLYRMSDLEWVEDYFQMVARLESSEALTEAVYQEVSRRSALQQAG